MSFDLRAARLNAGHTQRSLAAEVGVPRQTIATLEDGSGRAHPANAKKIADYFAVQVTDIRPVEREVA
jgi:DNA-binding XRE family transcriptional regulator